MPIRFRCPGCGARIAFPRRFAGLPGVCPRCLGRVTVPGLRGGTRAALAALGALAAGTALLLAALLARPNRRPPESSAGRKPP
jgi:hypothetical protein